MRLCDRKRLVNVAHIAPWEYDCHMSIVEDNFQITMSADEIVGERVAIWMKRRSLTGVDVGEFLGISRQSVSRKCGGHVSWSLTELARLATLLEVPLSELIPEYLTDIERKKLALEPQGQWSRLRESNSRPSHYE